MKNIIIKVILSAMTALMLTGGILTVHAAQRTVLGVERVAEYDELLQGKRVGLLTNQTGVDSNLRSTVEILRARYNLAALFVPEHGFYGAIKAGEEFSNDSFDGLKVFSLYGDSKRPSAEMLQEIDVLCVDLQDVGVRHYTYVSSMAYVMETCAAEGKPVIVFDRPNPLGGKVEGPVLKTGYESFIGLYHIPLRHGLTIGEYAAYINDKYKIGCQLTVIPMKNWRRSMRWHDTNLLWVGTSPLIPSADTAFLYAVTGVIGDTSLSVGVGTAKPFYYVGAPFADEREVYAALSKLQLPYVSFRATAFIPRYGKYEGKLVKGVEIYLTEPDKVNTAELGYLIVYTLRQLYPEQVQFPERGYVDGYKADIALGEASLRLNEAPEKAFTRWRQETEAFEREVSPYLLYK